MIYAARSAADFVDQKAGDIPPKTSLKDTHLVTACGRAATFA